MAHGRDAGPAGWPEPPGDWEDSRATFHLWTQVVGKVRTACTPLISHWWNTAFQVTARGFTTSLIPYRPGLGFQIDFDLVDHRLVIATTDGAQRTRDLRPEPVADFHRAVMRLLADLGLPVEIRPMPVEIPGTVVPFDRDRDHRGYDPHQVERFWRTTAESARVFELFRHRFLGKTSPVHLFWGALDLATSRFSGREAPEYTGRVPHLGPGVMREAYSREVSSSGYWPGPDGTGLYYAYVYPEPEGFRDAAVRPAQARYDPALGEFTLPYESVRSAPDPDAALLDFLQSAYDAAADLGRWDRALLDRPADAVERDRAGAASRERT